MTLIAVNQYATLEELTAFVGETYAVPAEPDINRVLQRASEVIAEATFWASERVWFAVDEDHPEDVYTNALRDATCAQVEFWLEVGEGFDVSNAQGSMAISRVQIHRLPPKLALRAYRILRQSGLVTAMRPIQQ